MNALPSSEQYVEIFERIHNKLYDAKIEISGDLKFLLINVSSESFAGKSLLEQHKMLNDVLKDLLRENKIHAISYETSSPLRHLTYKRCDSISSARSLPGPSI